MRGRLRAGFASLGPDPRLGGFWRAAVSSAARSFYALRKGSAGGSYRLAWSFVSLHLPRRDYLRHSTCNSFAANIELERHCDDGAFVFFRDFRIFFLPVACACAPLHLQPPPALTPPHRGGISTGPVRRARPGLCRRSPGQCRADGQSQSRLRLPAAGAGPRRGRSTAFCPCRPLWPLRPRSRRAGAL